MLISFAVTPKLICVFVFAYAKSRFSHDEAHFSQSPELELSFGHSLPPFKIGGARLQMTDVYGEHAMSCFLAVGWLFFQSSLVLPTLHSKLG